MICVIGDSILDEYKFGDAKRISPEAPVPIINVDKSEIRLGGSANVLNNILNLTNDIDFITIVGSDIYGKKLKSMIAEKGVTSDGIITDYSRCTTLKTRIISQNQQVVRIDNENTHEINKEIENEIICYLSLKLSKYRCVVISDYAKGMMTNNLTQRIIELLNDNNIPVLIDPKGKDYSKYKNATIITPNKKEAEQALNRKIESLDEVFDSLAEFKVQFNISNPIMTLSENGMALLEQGNKIHVKSSVKNVYDVTGAGDTVIGVLSYCIHKGYSISKSVEIANKAGSLVVSKQGTSTISYSEFCTIIGVVEFDFTHFNRSRNSKKIVFTNGCFDILHRGHVQYLKEAKKLGEVLIVGVNSDESVKRLKGNKRPINSLQDRIFMLESLQIIDHIIPFNEDDPYKLIEKLKPDILVKGGDYKQKKIVGENLVKELVLIDFVEGYSTSLILEKLQD